MEQLYKELLALIKQEYIYGYNLKEFEKLDESRFSLVYFKDGFKDNTTILTVIKPLSQGLTTFLISLRIKQDIEQLKGDEIYTDELGLDSLGVVDLILHLEESLELDIPDMVVPVLFNIKNTWKYVYSYFIVEFLLRTRIGILTNFNSEFGFQNIPKEIIKEILGIFQKESNIEVENEERFFNLQLAEFILYILLSEMLKQLLKENRLIPSESRLNMGSQLNKTIDRTTLNNMLEKMSRLLELRVSPENFKEINTLEQLIFSYINFLKES